MLSSDLRVSHDGGAPSRIRGGSAFVVLANIKEEIAA
jgi:hypothetical protein